MTAQTPDAPAGPPSPVAAAVASAELPRLLAREYTAWALTRPLWVALWVAAAILSVAAAAVSVAARDATLLVLVGAWLALLGVIAALVHGLTRSSVSRAFPAGSSFSASFDGAVLTLSSAMGRSEVAAPAVRRVDTSAHAVFLRLTTARGAVAIVPRAAFPAADLERLRAAVGGR